MPFNTELCCFNQKTRRRICEDLEKTRRKLARLQVYLCVIYSLFTQNALQLGNYSEDIYVNEDFFWTLWKHQKKIFIVLMCLRRVCKILHKRVHELSCELESLKTFVVDDFMNLEQRPDGPPQPNEIIFRHEKKWYVVTMENLDHMLSNPRNIQFVEDSKSKLNIHCTTPLPDAFHNIECIKKMSFIINIPMINGKNMEITSASILKSHGFDGMKHIIQILHRKVVYVKGKGNCMLYFNLHVPIIDSIILYASHCIGVFLTGPILVCASCHKNLKKKDVKSHLTLHNPFFSSDVLEAIKHVSMQCPNCHCLNEKIQGSDMMSEGCNHIRCQQCTIGMCFRCQGIRNERYESTYENGDKIIVGQRQCVSAFIIIATGERVEKIVPICPNTCKEKHNRHAQILKQPDGTWKRIVCCDSNDISCNMTPQPAQTTIEVLQQIPEFGHQDIADALIAQEIADAMRAQVIADAQRAREMANVLIWLGLRL